MAEGAEAGDRTEAATPRRLQRAREEGQVAVSQELPLLGGLAGAGLALMLIGPASARELAHGLQPFLGPAWDLPDGVGSALRAAMCVGFDAAAPILFASLGGALAAWLIQTGLLLHPAALLPDLTRLDPRRGLRRILGMDGLAEGVRALAKMSVLGIVAWRALAGDLPMLADAPSWHLGALPDQVLREILHLLIPVLIAQAGIAALDLLWVRSRHVRSLRMSREEIRQEMKETEGDPHVKQRLRTLRRSRARRRMLAAVPKATVVVTNPTHYAVALAYDRARQAAPRVVAKGVDEVAARIRAVAKENGVPLVANPPLARALHQVEVDTEIPPEHFQAVAGIIAYVWRLQGRLRAGTGNSFPKSS